MASTPPPPPNPAPQRTVSPWFRRGAIAAFALLLLVLAGGNLWNPWVGCGSAGLLGGKTPSRSAGITRAHVLTDGVRAVDGDAWNTNLTVELPSGAFAEYDLGEPKPIRAIYLQGDNNDEYVVSTSEDGQRFAPLWRAQPTSGPGLQPRSVNNLDATARYVRIDSGKGDASRSVSELQLFSQAPPSLPFDLIARRGLPKGERVRGHLLAFVFAAGFFLFATSRKSSWAWTGACFLAPLIAGLQVALTLTDLWPVDAREVSFVRAATAGLAALAVIREVSMPLRFPARRAAVFGALGIAAFGAFLSFYNLGRPQFFDHGQRKPTFIHSFDMRVYYPVAKYFQELRFDGLYQASVAAYVDDDPSVTLDSLDQTELRDLHDHRMTRVADVKEQIRDVKGRFSPERWQSFLTDMRYFREAMGTRDYLGSMHDHGGNATPVWLAIAHVLFRWTHASDATLLAGALLDPVLLLFAFFMVGRTFGWRTMLISVVVFGANDFYMFGSNWAGATLRHDWLAYLMLGVCALRSKRWTLAGVILALSASIRAFPALAIVGVSFAMIWWVFEHVRANHRSPTWRAFREAQGPVLRVILGALAGSLVLFLLSSAVLSFDAWPSWLSKVAVLERDAHMNHISLRGLIAGSDSLQPSVLLFRMPVFAVSAALCAAACFWGARNRLEHAAIMGSLLIPVAFNPANYYIHFVMVLPLLAIESSRSKGQAASEPIGWHDAGIWLAILGVCVAQYWTTLVRDMTLHFQLATALFFAGAGAVLAVHLHRNRKTAENIART